MRWGIAAVVVACFGVALADEMDNANRDIATLTAEGARSWNAGRVLGDQRCLISNFEHPPILKDHVSAGSTYGAVVVHAEVVEPLALRALSTKHYVVYRNLETLDPECEKYLDKGAFRPSLPAIKLMTPGLANRLKSCRDRGGEVSTPLHVCGLKSIDEESLRILGDVPLCLCGLEAFSEEEARAIRPWEWWKRAVLLSNKTKVSDDAWRVIADPKAVSDASFAAAEHIRIDPFILILEGRCRHREITFATPDEHKARQPRPAEPQRLLNPFNR